MRKTYMLWKKEKSFDLKGVRETLKFNLQINKAKETISTGYSRIQLLLDLDHVLPEV
jgi:hypothetical protein